MIKKLVFVFLAVALFGGSALAFAWWDNLDQDLQNQELQIGTGVRLETPSMVSDGRDLVPSGSFYAAYEAEYTTEYVFTYTLTLEDALQEGMSAKLDISISDFTEYLVNDVLYTFNDSGVINLSIDNATFAGGVWTTDEDVFTGEENVATIVVRITLENHPNPAFADFYNAVKELEISFTIGFEVVNTGSSVLPE